jgi:hypothetical protein
MPIVTGNVFLVMQCQRTPLPRESETVLACCAVNKHGLMTTRIDFPSSYAMLFIDMVPRLTTYGFKYNADLHGSAWHDDRRANDS